MTAFGRAPASPTHRANFNALYWDIFGFGVLAGTAINFLPIYAVRIGADPFHVGLLTSGPALVNLILSLPAGQWLRHRDVLRMTQVTALINRLGYVIMAVLPWLLPPALILDVLPIVVVGMALPGVILAISFNATFAEVVPPEWRAVVVGRRNALLAIASTIASLGGGQLLGLLPEPLNYQVLFMIGALGGYASAYFVWRVRRLAPLRNGDTAAQSAQAGRFSRWLNRARVREVLRLDLIRSRFGLLMLAYLVFYLAQFTSIPLQPVFWVQELRLTDFEIGIGNALFYLTLMVGSLALAPVTARIGMYWPMTVGAVLYGLYPLIMAQAHDAWLYYVASLLGGVIWGIAGGSLTGWLMEGVPADDRPSHMALHNVVLNLGTLSGTLLGPALASLVGTRDGLWISGWMRVVAGVAIGLLARPRPTAALTPAAPTVDDQSV